MAIPQDDATSGERTAAGAASDLDPQTDATCWRFRHASGALRRITHGHQRADGFVARYPNPHPRWWRNGDFGKALGMLLGPQPRKLRRRSPIYASRARP